ncbi:MAG TPA: hypothetical protein VFH54_13925 [Mycobacteriales bacterium]|nr:hypothetical protein [Mycobacteriales bacterium]
MSAPKVCDGGEEAVKPCKHRGRDLVAVERVVAEHRASSLGRCYAKLG